MLTVPEAAESIGRSPETVRRWIRAGRLPASKVGTQHLIDEGDLAEFLGTRAGNVAETTEPYNAGPAAPAAAGESWRRRIRIDPSVLLGKPVVRRTRLSVELVLDLLAAGWSTQDLLDAYPVLAADDIRACIAYAAERLREERVYTTPTG